MAAASAVRTPASRANARPPADPQAQAYAEEVDLESGAFPLSPALAGLHSRFGVPAVSFGFVQGGLESGDCRIGVVGSLMEYATQGFWAIAPCSGSSRIWNTIRTARSRTSSGNFFGAGMTPSFARSGAATEPGAAQPPGCPTHSVRGPRGWVLASGHGVIGGIPYLMIKVAVEDVE